MVENDFKYLIGHKDVKKLDLYSYFFPIWVHVEEILMKLNMSFLIKNDELLEKYVKIWEKVSNIIKNEFNSEPVYKYLKN